MRFWPAIFVPPVVFLSLLTGGYALVPWACENQARAPLHLVAGLALAFTVGGMLLAWRDWQEVGLKKPDDKAERSSWIRLLCVLGLMVSTLFTIAVMTLWLTTFVMPPCVR